MNLQKGKLAGLMTETSSQETKAATTLHNPIYYAHQRSRRSTILTPGTFGPYYIQKIGLGW